MTCVESLAAALAAVAPDVVDADVAVASALVEVLLRIARQDTLDVERVAQAVELLLAMGRLGPSLPSVRNWQ